MPLQKQTTTKTPYYREKTKTLIFMSKNTPPYYRKNKNPHFMSKKQDSIIEDIKNESSKI